MLIRPAASLAHHSEGGAFSVRLRSDGLGPPGTPSPRSPSPSPREPLPSEPLPWEPLPTPPSHAPFLFSRSTPACLSPQGHALLAQRLVTSAPLRPVNQPDRLTSQTG